MQVLLINGSPHERGCTYTALSHVAKEYDGYVFGTPVYYAGMNGSLKAFMDRVFFSDLWGQQNTFTLKPAASVITAPPCRS